jgi:hypothetical protein
LPLIETLTLLASLGSALQTLRTGRAVEEQNESKEDGSTGLLLSYEYAKASQESAIRADDSITGRMQVLLLVSGTVIASVSAIGAGFVDGIGAGSPLFIAALALLGVVAIAAALAVTVRPALIALNDGVAGEWEFLRGVLGRAAQLERSNLRLIATKSAALALLYACFAAQVLLLAVWVLEA